jgi:hypothetical protein
MMEWIEIGGFSLCQVLLLISDETLLHIILLFLSPFSVGKYNLCVSNVTS